MNFRRDILTLEAAELKLTYGLVPWDTDIFGFPVAQIDSIQVRSAGADRLFPLFENWRDTVGARLVSCRLPHDSLVESMFLEERGFRFVEMVYGPRLDHLDRLSLVPDAPVISVATQDDLLAIERIAGHAFTTGRFLLDPRLDPALSAERYRVWVRNSFDNPRHVVLKAEIDGAMIGFFITEDRDDGSAYWHLTAIAPECQGRGLGTMLWTAMAVRHREAGRTSIETTISAHNPPVINLYARLGFRFLPPSMTLHWADASRVP